MSEKTPGSSFGGLKGLRGFPADGNTVLCERWQLRDILFQLIMRSVNERSYICSFVAVCPHTGSKRLLEILPVAPGWLRLRFWGLRGAEHHPCPVWGVSQGIRSQTRSGCCVLKT